MHAFQSGYVILKQTPISHSASMQTPNFHLSHLPRASGCAVSIIEICLLALSNTFLDFASLFNFSPLWFISTLIIPPCLFHESLSIEFLYRFNEAYDCKAALSLCPPLISQLTTKWVPYITVTPSSLSNNLLWTFSIPFLKWWSA